MLYCKQSDFYFIANAIIVFAIKYGEDGRNNAYVLLISESLSMNFFCWIEIVG